MDDLAGNSFASQRLVEGQIERHGVRPLALEQVALERRHGKREVVGIELVIGAVDLDDDQG